MNSNGSLLNFKSWIHRWSVASAYSCSRTPRSWTVTSSANTGSRTQVGGREPGRLKQDHPARRRHLEDIVKRLFFPALRVIKLFYRGRNVTRAFTDDFCPHVYCSSLAPTVGFWFQPTSYSPSDLQLPYSQGQLTNVNFYNLWIRGHNFLSTLSLPKFFFELVFTT